MCRSIAVTGATGLVGSHLCDYFRRKGWIVHAIVQPDTEFPFEKEGIEFFRCDLPDDLEQGAFDGVDVVIHAAYMTVFLGIKQGRRINEEGTRRVLTEARSADVRRFIFISSLSAQPSAISYYGQSKYELEQILGPSTDLAVRPGLVMARRGGLFGRMSQQIAHSRAIPIFDGGRQVVQTIYIDDLCEAISRAIERDVVGRIAIAEPDGVTMRELIGDIARRQGKEIRLVNLPHKPVVAVLRLAEALHAGLPISSENVLGLVCLKHVETTADLARLGLAVRSVHQSLDEIFAAD